MKKTLSKKIIWVKKNLIDPTASLVYGLGVSIVHLAMLVSFLFVQQPQIELSENMGEACKSEAQS